MLTIGHIDQGVDYASGQIHQLGTAQYQPAHMLGHDSTDNKIKIFIKWLFASYFMQFLHSACPI